MPYAAHADEILMRRLAQQGDERAFAELYDRYSARMYRFFLRMLERDAARAEDFTQDLFLKIMDKAALFDPSRRFSTWLYTLASNMCKNEYRRHSPVLMETAFFPDEAIFMAEHQPEYLDKPFVERQLQCAIDRLDALHRQCFVLRWQEELSLREIADIVGCPEGTVKSRLHHALCRVSEAVRQTTKV